MLVDINWNPGPGRLRLFAALLPVLAAVVAGVLNWRFGLTTAPLLLVAAALVVGLLGLARPDWFRPVYVAWMGLGLPINWLLSHAIMLGLYFLLLTPLGLAMRCLGYDPLRRRLDRRATTYWTARPPVDDKRRYFRPF
ncbi:MAG: hypothetical protein J5I93_26100 [Pirellulaceae bacterium]|nr:hypothetical protein [Pirellulaceae bacterium]